MVNSDGEDDPQIVNHCTTFEWQVYAVLLVLIAE